MEVSSLHVPAGWSCVPCPAMPSQAKLPRGLNSNGTPKASPTAMPYTQSRTALLSRNVITPIDIVAPQGISQSWGELLPYYLDRLNDTLPPKVTGLERSIKDYFHDNLYVSPSGMFYEAPFRLCLDELGADHILWASDYPYRPIGEARTFLEGFGLPKEDLALIAHGNAERVFGL